MKRLLVLLSGIVLMLVFLSPCAAHDPFPGPGCAGGCCPQWLTGNVIVADRTHQTAVVSVEGLRHVTLQFNHSAQGVCSGAQSREPLTVFPAVGDPVALRTSASCQQCLATC